MKNKEIDGLESKKFYDSLVNCSAYSMPANCRQIWANQYGKGYLFSDGSYFIHYNRGLGPLLNLKETVKYNHWASCSYGDKNRTLWAIKSIKYAIN